MLHHINPDNLIVIDIETVPMVSSTKELSKEMFELYLEKSKRLVEPDENDEQKFFNHAGIYAEFGKVVCISVGVFTRDKKEKKLKFRVKSFAGTEEKKLLEDFFQLLNKHYKDDKKFLFAGHNIREFDVPYLCRRGLINGIKLPALLNISGKKPYEVNYVDTMQLWRFGDYKHYTSLKLLCEIFKIPTSKDDISGKDVGRVFWKEKNIERISVYCKKDVLAVAQLIRRFRGEELLTDDEIVFVN